MPGDIQSFTLGEMPFRFDQVINGFSIDVFHHIIGRIVLVKDF